jgi:hypothetical protein
MDYMFLVLSDFDIDDRLDELFAKQVPFNI